MDSSDRKYKSEHDRKRLVGVACRLARTRPEQMFKIYDALKRVSGDPVNIRWKILEPLGRWPQLDMQRLDGTVMGPPIGPTLSALPEIQKVLADLLAAIELAQAHLSTLHEMRPRIAREFSAELSGYGDPQLTAEVIARIAEGWLAQGDQVMDLHAFLKIGHDLGRSREIVTQHRATAARYLGKTKAKRLKGRPHNLELAERINHAVPRSRAYGGDHKSQGIYRAEVVDPTRAIIYGAYLIEIPREKLIEKIRNRKGPEKH